MSSSRGSENHVGDRVADLTQRRRQAFRCGATALGEVGLAAAAAAHVRHRLPDEVAGAQPQIPGRLVRHDDQVDTPRGDRAERDDRRPPLEPAADVDGEPPQVLHGRTRRCGRRDDRDAADVRR